MNCWQEARRLGSTPASHCEREIPSKSSPALPYYKAFLAVLVLHRYSWVFPSCSKQALLFAVVRGLLIAVASLGKAQALGRAGSAVVVHGLSGPVACAIFSD